jgi:hypothetical protein
VLFYEDLSSPVSSCYPGHHTDRESVTKATYFTNIFNLGRPSNIITRSPTSSYPRRATPLPHQDSYTRRTPHSSTYVPSTAHRPSTDVTTSAFTSPTYTFQQRKTIADEAELAQYGSSMFSSSSPITQNQYQPQQQIFQQTQLQQTQPKQTQKLDPANITPVAPIQHTPHIESVRRESINVPTNSSHISQFFYEFIPSTNSVSHYSNNIKHGAKYLMNSVAMFLRTLFNLLFVYTFMYIWHRTLGTLNQFASKFTSSRTEKKKDTFNVYNHDYYAHHEHFYNTGPEAKSDVQAILQVNYDVANPM